MKHLAVIIPAKDEEATMEALLDRLARVHVPGFSLNVLVVDDGSTDRTAEISRAKQATVVSHPTNRGLGAALRTGLSAAVERSAYTIAYLDADLEYWPEDLPTLIEPITAGRADYVCGSRFLGERSGPRSLFRNPLDPGREPRTKIRPRMEVHRRVGNVAFTMLLILLTRRWMTDGQTGMRAFSREAASRAEIIHDYNYAQVLTLDLLRKGFAFEEVPIRYTLREHGESFIDWRYPARVLPAIWRELRAR